MRRLVEGDAEAFGALRRAGAAAAPDLFRFDLDDDFTLSPSATRARIARARVVGGFDEDRLVAIGAVEPFEGGRVRHKWLLWGIYAAQRGQGWGDRLMTALIAEARDGRAQSVQLTVMADNMRAIALYERSGFTRYALEPQSVARSDGLADEVSMRRVLVLERAP